MCAQLGTGVNGLSICLGFCLLNSDVIQQEVLHIMFLKKVIDLGHCPLKTKHEYYVHFTSHTGWSNKICMLCFIGLRWIFILTFIWKCQMWTYFLDRLPVTQSVTVFPQFPYEYEVNNELEWSVINANVSVCVLLVLMCSPVGWCVIALLKHLCALSCTVLDSKLYPNI